jgi:hypothetical protein
LWWGSTSTTSESATEFWSEAGWGTDLLVGTTEASASTAWGWASTVRVSAFAIGAKATTSLFSTTSAFWGRWSTGRWGGGGLTHEGLWENLSWDVEVLTKVVDTFVGQGPVEVTPCELLLDESTGLEGLHKSDDHVVGGQFALRVLCQVSVLDGDHDAILEQLLVDFLSDLFWDQHIELG